MYLDIHYVKTIYKKNQSILKFRMEGEFLF
jgi:hypothetical protein